MTWIAVGTAAFKFTQAQNAAKIQEGESKVSAAQAKLIATQREADRKSLLAQAIASQNAAAGASNIAAFEGSPLTIMREDIKAEEVATEREEFSAKLGRMTELARGGIAAKQMQTGATIGLLSDLAKAYDKNSSRGKT